MTPEDTTPTAAPAPNSSSHAICILHSLALCLYCVLAAGHVSPIVDQQNINTNLYYLFSCFLTKKIIFMSRFDTAHIIGSSIIGI